jgi:membrane protease YdiL (CAAX protease family)
VKALVLRFPFATFLLIAFGWTWPLAAGIRVSMILPLLALFGPLLGAVVVLGIMEGREGLARLWRKFALRRRHLPWLAVAIALPLFLVIPVWCLERLSGSALELALGPISALSLILAFLIVGEEVGWRGFALPHLLERWPALWSGIGLGVVWALWHLPNFFLPGFPHQDLPFTAFILMIVSFSILFTWLYLRTQGSLLVAVVFHAALNLFSVAGLDPARQYWWRALVYGLMALAVVAGGGLRAASPSPDQREMV